METSKKNKIITWSFVGSLVLFFGSALYFYETSKKNVNTSGNSIFPIFNRLTNIGNIKVSNAIVSLQGQDFIKGFETLKLEAYLCSSGVPTIGYGHTKNVKIGDKITESQANSYFKSDLNYFEKLVRNKLASSGITTIKGYIFDMLVSHAYNSGELNATQHYIEWGNTKKLWDWWTEHYITACGVYSNGLYRRRTEEMNNLKNGYDTIYNVLN